MKCFEIEEVDEMINKRFAMNLKHEMFWNFDIAWFVEFNCLYEP